MNKILSFIINKNNNKLLLLKGSDKDPQFHESFWYVVTGYCEEYDKNLIDTVKREVKEETNLNLYKIIDLDWVFEYESLGINCTERTFISYTNEDNIKLNEENIDYKWCDFEEFIGLIKWHYDKKELYDKLKKYIGVENE